MKKWLEFFFLGFFSHERAKEGTKRGYTNVFLGFLLALLFIFTGFIGGYTLSFGVHYGNSPEFKDVAYTLLANDDEAKRIYARIENGEMKLGKHGGDYTVGLIVNTLDNEADKQIYAKNGYNVVVDTRPADTLAEVEVYCISNDGKETTISYEEYLSLSEVARLNFDYKLRYTGKELVLDDKAVAEYRAYVEGLGGDVRAKSDKAALDLSAGEITQDEYNRVIYEAYFTSYYPEIGAYESTSKVPLLRNYYYHEYISKNISNYLFIFDDYITASFKTASGIDVSFYGFYSELGDGAVVREGASSAEARASVDGFITGSFGANWFLNAYAYLVNTVSIAPFIALMILVATLLGYSVMKLKGVESIASLGEMLKVVGSFVWFSGAVSALGSVAISFFVSRGLINALPPVLFFVTLLARSIVFTVIESRRYREQAEQKTESTEV
ncbi:MAG: hypothetical protein IKC87_03215 [Clostridia bacterium]|nr:hypothetical protein [Clostridia bacterium]